MVRPSRLIRDRGNASEIRSLCSVVTGALTPRIAKMQTGMRPPFYSGDKINPSCWRSPTEKSTPYHANKGRRIDTEAPGVFGGRPLLCGSRGRSVGIMAAILIGPAAKTLARPLPVLILPAFLSTTAFNNFEDLVPSLGSPPR